MLGIRMFYHVYATGAWSVPVLEHFAALADSDIPGPVHVGLVGAPEDRARARQIIIEHAGDRRVTFAAADEGFEQMTLREVHRCALYAKTKQAYLYCHTKGAFNDNEINTAWRRSMTYHVVNQWRNCLAMLEDGWDTVGCHWLTPERDHIPDRPIHSPYYGGNFWWATTTYLKTLSPVEDDSRHHAESWIGRADPAAYDLLPGFPAMHLFTRPDETMGS